MLAIKMMAYATLASLGPCRAAAAACPVLIGLDLVHAVAVLHEDYERAMRAKLLRELDTPAVSGWPVVEEGA